MEEVKGMRRKDGTFLPGSGNHGNRRHSDLIEKGKSGFQPSPVVLIKPSGEVLRLPSVVAAQKFLGLRNRQMVSRAIRGKYAKRGYKIMYEKDYSPLGDYSFRLSEMRDDEGYAKPELLRIYRKRQEQMMTDEQRRRRSERCREVSKRQAADPNSKWGKGTNYHPIHCETNGKDYASIKDAVEDLGIPSNQISLAISRNGTTHGYKFYDKASWDRTSARLNEILGRREEAV